MTCFRVHGDADGDTYLTPLEPPIRETPAGRVRSMGDVPMIDGGIAQFVDSRKPDSGIHEAPRRQFIVVLGGVLEIETSLGQVERLGPGDVLLADDVGTKGHHSRDVGDVPLTMMTVGIGDDWPGPPA
jgi:hypothetical protein